MLGYRAANLAVMDSKQHRNFYAAFHRRGYLQEEPLDRILKIQKPQKVKSMIHFVCSRNLIDMTYLLGKVWHVELPFLAKLLGIHSSFLENYVPDHGKSNVSTVSDLASYR